MSLNEFIELVHNVNDSRPLLQYIEKHIGVLSQYQHDNDLYGMIIKSLITKDCHEYIKTRYPWKYVSQFIAQMYCIEITKDDLDSERMEDLVDIYAYFNLVVEFLESHEIHEIPESFLVFYKQIDMYFFNSLASVIKSKFTVNSIKLFSLFLTQYNHNFKNFMKQDRYNPNKKMLFDTLKQVLGMHFDTKKSYKNTVINDDNIIDLFFDIYKSHDISSHHQRAYVVMYEILNLLIDIYDKKELSYNITSRQNMNLEIIFYKLQTVANYFEFMRIDQQIIFWNILINDYREFIGLLVKYSFSDIFITYAFNEFPDLHDKSILSKIIFQSNDRSNMIYNITFFNFVLKKFPEMKDDIIIHYVFNNLSFCFHLFPELYDGDSKLITDAFDRKLSSGYDFFPNTQLHRLKKID